jgi:hypothetical protein
LLLAQAVKLRLRHFLLPASSCLASVLQNPAQDKTSSLDDGSFMQVAAPMGRAARMDVAVILSGSP